MNNQWNLINTNNINQMLRARTNIDTNQKTKEFPNLLIVKHNFHIADDIMFPDPSCLAFFSAFENNHLIQFEEKDELVLLAVDIHEGLMQFYIYCKDAKKSVYDCIEFLKSNELYKCEFEIILNDNGQRLDKII